jgi:hypothetical protein
MCPTLNALDLVVEVGSAAIPGVGKAITTGISKFRLSPMYEFERLTKKEMGVKTAKMFKNSYDAAEAATEWASMVSITLPRNLLRHPADRPQFVDVGFGLAGEAGCPTPFSFSKADLAKRFLDFADAPDALIPEGINYDELPCPKGKKASKKCKERNGDHDDNDKPSPTPTKDTSQPAKTSDPPVNTPKSDCAAIGQNDLDVFLADNPSAVEKRVVGTTLHSRRLQSRNPKRGEACEGSRKTEVKSKRFPSSGDVAMVRPA